MEVSETIGACFALFTGLCWAGSSTILKFLTAKIDTLSLNTIRLWIGSIVLLSFVSISGRGDDLIYTPLLPILFVITSGIMAIAAGDTIYIKSLTFIDVSRAFPIGQCMFPILTMLVAILFLGESFTWFNGIGAVLVLSGVYLVAVVGKGPNTYPTPRRSNIKGVILVLTAAIFWAIGAAVLKIGVTEMDSFIAAAIRIPVSAMVLTGLVISHNRRESALKFQKYGSINLLLTIGAGILTYGIASVSYVTAMQLMGAGRTVLITAVSPIFIVPLSILFLKEKPNLFTIVGIFTCIGGVYLVAI